MSDLFHNVPSHDQREHFCACGARGVYGYANAWFCRNHVPPGFLPHLWGPRADQPSVCVRCDAVKGTPEADQLCKGRNAQMNKEQP